MVDVAYERPTLVEEPKPARLKRRRVNQNTVEVSTPEGTPFDKLQIISQTKRRATSMFACRLAGRGCRRNQFRHKSVPCESCVPAGANEPLGTLIERLVKE